ncbi:MAG: sugar ABC transporter substrate-binding protein [Candidatus Marinimicrobia bacterium]|nr:sugar ABC transporter substrate-binding protein [Candidatus Neomarinimicrobiota bacterium]
MMRRLISWILYYKGFIIAGLLAIIIISTYIAGEMASRLETDVVQTGPLRFLSLAWQVEAVEAVQEITAQWNQLHPEQQVELTQGTWNSIHDYLITGFETGDIPDIFHYESAVIVDFALRGYLADLAPYITEEMQADVLAVDWASVTRSSGEVIGIPFINESFIVLYNQDIFDAAGIATPSFDNPWTWTDLLAAARKLTLDQDGDGLIDQWGVAMGLRNSANFIMNHSIAFGGSFFYHDEQGGLVTRVGKPEKELLGTILKMLYEDQTMTPSSIGKSSTETIPGFLAGKYAMVVGIGSWARQQVMENASDDFHWSVMPPMKARTQAMGLNTQTLSIPKSCTRQAVAMEFITFLLSSENMTRLAGSDWMMPARKSSLNDPRFQTEANGWLVVTESAQYLSTGPWVGLPGYIEWKSRVANPVFQELFAGRLSLEEAAQRIEKESNSVLARYQVRGLKW